MSFVEAMSNSLIELRAELLLWVEQWIVLYVGLQTESKAQYQVHQMFGRRFRSQFVWLIAQLPVFPSVV